MFGVVKFKLLGVICQEQGTGGTFRVRASPPAGTVNLRSRQLLLPRHELVFCVCTYLQAETQREACPRLLGGAGPSLRPASQHRLRVGLEEVYDDGTWGLMAAVVRGRRRGSEVKPRSS